MNQPATTNAVATPADQARREVSSRQSTSAGQSKDSVRLFIFTALSLLMCALALANVASAATTAGEDQYIEQTPNGGGNGSGSGNGTGNNNYVQSIGGDNGTVTQGDVKGAAERNRKENNKNSGDDGSTGSTGTVGAGAGGPSSGAPSVQSVTEAAKLGPLNRSTAFLLLGLAAALGGVAFAMRHRSAVHSTTAG
jgi:hypothetical protein